jgi:hypothetical protein
MYWASENGHLEIVRYLISLGYPTDIIEDERCKRYIAFCDRMEQRKKLLAQKKIYYWWIQICYDPETNVGKRMLEKSWVEFDKIQKKN